MRWLSKAIIRLKVDSEGFSLVETMIGAMVFSIGILGMAALQYNAISRNTLAEDVQLNSVISMAGIEELMATDYTDERIAGNLTECDDSDDKKYRLCVTPLDEAAIPGAKKVVVTSQFMQNGLPQTVTFKIFKPFIATPPVP